MDRPNSAGNGQGGSGRNARLSRDPRLSWFGTGGRYDKARPSGRMLVVLDELSAVSSARTAPPTPLAPSAGKGPAEGKRRPLATATDDEVVGMMDRWEALGAHAEAGKLTAIRELIRRRARRPRSGLPAAPYPGDLPASAQWDIGVSHEVAAQLRISWQAAEPLIMLAWELEARLPGVGRLLDHGVLSPLKAKIIAEEFSVLDDEKIAEAQKLLLEEDLDADDMTPGRLRRLCQRIVDTIDPEGQRKRREQAEREHSRVSFFRSHGGDAAMFACGLPADEALMAKANIQQRAVEYNRAMVYPDARMDMLRVLALVDLVNGCDLDGRIAKYHAEKTADDARQATERAADRDALAKLGGCPVPPVPGAGADDANTGDKDWPAPPVPDEEPEDLGDDDIWPGFGPDPGDVSDPSDVSDPGDAPGSGDVPESNDRDPGDHAPGGLSGSGTARDLGLPALAHLTLPLATLLHLSETPGETPGFGSVDPALARRLAKAAARSPRTRFCLTVTDGEGHAAGHACARLIRGAGRRDTSTGSRDGPPGGIWDLTPDRTRPGPGGGYGSWILTVPGGLRYRLDLHPVPVHDCDHRFATSSYRPGALLRHLVEVRDGECFFTGCSRTAAQCDFEHAIPYDRGGVTDACNTGACSRRCHQVKQSEGWHLTQPKPGWHQWRTPSGRTFTKGPKHYTA